MCVCVCTCHVWMYPWPVVCLSSSVVHTYIHVHVTLPYVYIQCVCVNLLSKFLHYSIFPTVQYQVVLPNRWVPVEQSICTGNHTHTQGLSCLLISYPLLSRMMSDASTASASSFHTEKRILPLRSATRHFLTTLPSLVWLVDPKETRLGVNYCLLITFIQAKGSSHRHHITILLTPVYNYKNACYILHSWPQLSNRHYSVVWCHNAPVL